MALTYLEAVGVLDSLITGVPSSSQGGESRRAIMAALLAATGNPQQGFHAIHVAGTSGKGSTCAYLDAILRAAGLRTGLHTTPYLQSPVEKIQVDGKHISPTDLAALAQEFLERIDETRRPTYVQAWTALTLSWFARQQVDIAVIEASLGGRFDATNHLCPIATIITNVHLDHTATLGSTVREIAWHKAGIAKPGVPMITGSQHPDAIEVIEGECHATGSPILRLGRDFFCVLVGMDSDGAVFDYRSSRQEYQNLKIAMLGEHQVTNAALAVATASALNVPETAIRDGLQTAILPGRMEMVQKSPLVLLDGAHNPAKAGALRAALDRLFVERRLVLLVALGASKDAMGVMDILVPRARAVVCTEAPVTGKPACPAEHLAGRARDHGVSVSVEGDPQRAIELGLSLCDDQDLLCVTGSLYLVGALRGRWHPAPAAL